MIASFTIDQREDIEQTYQVNRMLIFNALRDWSSLLSAFHTLPSALQRNPELISFAAQAFESSGQTALARALRADMRQGSAEQSSRHVTALPDPVSAIQSAIRQLSDLEMEDQTLAWSGRDIVPAVTSDVIDACCAVVNVAPILTRSQDTAPDEDRITHLLAELLRQRLHRLGWQVCSQGRGGFTGTDPSSGRGGIGEIDIEITSNAKHVLIGELIRLDHFDKGKLVTHFEKLFGYSPPYVPLLFNGIWYFGTRPEDFWEKYCSEIVKGTELPRFAFRRWETAPKACSGVWHSTSVHDHPDEQSGCHVTHVLVDLQRQSGRDAALDARTRRSRP